MLPVGNGHEIYWEESGNPDGIPAIYLHGGPGSGAGNGYRRMFDPALYRIISLDQRGCGRSRPLANKAGYDLAENTTPHLIADMEAVRRHLGVRRWLLSGASWGSTLALAYAQAHPDKVRGIVLTAVTTTSAAEVEWITETVGRVFPEAWDEFAGYAAAADIGYMPGKGRLVDAYARLLSDPDPDVRGAAAVAWCRWEEVHIQIGAGANKQRDSRYDDPSFRQVFATLVTHYWSNLGFAPEGGLIGAMSKLAGIPGVLIHGRRDISGPVQTAWDLHNAWRGSELIVIEDEGHGGERIAEAWAVATSRLAAHTSRG
ncbi:proline iminopeptidase [Antricoccus suffuscus]|uniref:Proline iminopeptidase n=2 Tax=Antricoccus suffuscus TaxID=1629062 RepID=A0A2T0ZYS5_9ACTN|nr:proline iminopeptidase [Antricoccus suffuscus]